MEYRLWWLVFLYTTKIKSYYRVHQTNISNTLSKSFCWRLGKKFAHDNTIMENITTTLKFLLGI